MNSTAGAASVEQGGPAGTSSEAGGRGGQSGFVGVLGAMSTQWLIADYACALKGLPVVLLHRASSAEQLAHIVQGADLRVLVVSVHLAHVVARAARTCAGGGGCLRHVVWVSDEAEAYASVLPTEPEEAALPAAVSSQSWEAMCATGAGAPRAVRARVATRTAPDAVVKLLPSSGSTGTPKLIPVTDATVCQRLRQPVRAGGHAGGAAGHRVVVYAYEVMRQSHEVLLGGGCIGVFSGCFSRLLPVRTPTCSCHPHRILSKVVRSLIVCTLIMIFLGMRALIMILGRTASCFDQLCLPPRLPSGAVCTRSSSKSCGASEGACYTRRQAPARLRARRARAVRPRRTRWKWA